MDRVRPVKGGGAERRGISMDIQEFDIPGVKLLTPQRFADDRGFFSETYNQKTYAAAGIPDVFVQDNHSLSREAGTVRGLHYQAPPFAQGKLVRVSRGRVLDVVVDVRRGSPAFGRHVSAMLTAAAGEQLWFPAGFLHGFVTLEPDTEVIYKVTNFYNRSSDGNVRWNDPDLGIDWGVGSAQARLSDKDAAAAAFADFDSPFEFVEG